MRYKLIIMAAVCGVLLAGCGRVAEEMSVGEVSRAIKVTEAPKEEDSAYASEDAAEKVVMTEADFEVPEGAAYKYVKSMEMLGSSYVTEIGYCDDKDQQIFAMSMVTTAGDHITAASRFENEYDENDRLVKVVQKFIYVEGELGGSLDDDESTTVLEYYDNGEIKRVNDGNFDIAFKYDYDEQGRKSAAYEYWDGSDEIFSTTYKEYDDNGDVIRDTVKFEGGKNKLDSVTEYEYDEKHRVVREESAMTNLGSGNPTITIYEYTDLK